MVPDLLICLDSWLRLNARRDLHNGLPPEQGRLEQLLGRCGADAISRKKVPPKRCARRGLLHPPMDWTMRKRAEIGRSRQIARLIRCIRDKRVILDLDLADLYGVETRVLNQAVKRNRERFPQDFVFTLTREEIQGISQAVISLEKLRFSRSVHAFTEHGALMAANILNSTRAVAMSVYIIRAFIQMREDLAANAAILKRLAEIDKTLLGHDLALRDIYQKLRPLLEPPAPPPRPQIGFHVREDDVPYRAGHRSARRPL